MTALVKVNGEVFAEEALVVALRQRDPKTTALVVDQLKADVLEKTGDSVALRLIQKSYRGLVIGILKSRWGIDSALADELWQDTLVRIWLRAKTFDPNRSQFLTWVINQARYSLQDYRRQMSRVAIPTDEPPKDVQVLREREPLTEREKAAIRRAFRQLKPTEQKLIRYRLVEGYEPVEIAQGPMKNEVSEKSIRVYLHRSLRRWRQLFEQALGGDSDER